MLSGLVACSHHQLRKLDTRPDLIRGATQRWVTVCFKWRSRMQPPPAPEAGPDTGAGGRRPRWLGSDVTGAALYTYCSCYQLLNTQYVPTQGWTAYPLGQGPHTPLLSKRVRAIRQCMRTMCTPYAQFVQRLCRTRPDPYRLAACTCTPTSAAATAGGCTSTAARASQSTGRWWRRWVGCGAVLQPVCYGVLRYCVIRWVWARGHASPSTCRGGAGGRCWWCWVVVVLAARVRWCVVRQVCACRARIGSLVTQVGGAGACVLRPYGVVCGVLRVCEVRPGQAGAAHAFALLLEKATDMSTPPTTARLRDPPPA